MTASPDTLKAFTDAAADAVARAIAGVQREASRFEDLRSAEHRAFMAEQRETLADLTRRVETTLANVKDGKDGRDGVDGVGIAGKDGRDGVDGKDGQSFDQAKADHEIELRAAEHRAFMAEQREIVAGLLRQVEDLKATVKDGKDGRDGVDGKDGAAGRDGIDGRDGADGINGKDGIDGAPGKDGLNGKDGADAYHGEARGLFDPEAAYRALDVVSFNGSEWRAKRDEPGELPGDGWMLSASRGKRGDRGDPGPQGKDGATSARIIAGYVDATDMQIILTNDDGSEVKVDVYELADAIRRA